MKTIGIADFEKLVMERLANPSSFAGKSLLLWNEWPNEDGSISYNVVRQCCIKYNIANPDDQVWVKYLDNFFNENITDIEAHCEEKSMWGYKRRGILYNTGSFFKNDHELWLNWLRFINTHVNSTGHLSEDWPLIACAIAYDHNLTEDLFADNCDIYDLNPSVEEWAQWLSRWYELGGAHSPIQCNDNVLSVVLKYIDKNGLTINFYSWNKIIQSVTRCMMIHHCETVDQIPEGELESEIQSIWVYDHTWRCLSVEERTDIARQLRLYSK